MPRWPAAPAAARAPLIAAPDGLGEGTNALLLRDLSIPTQFGRADSFRRHLGLLPQTASYYCEGLAFDIDDPGDLRAARLVAEASVPDELVVAAEDTVRVRDTVQR
jgi:2-phospho-L-lactate guanylyltransferase (CobY/MobA/RfbA family)